MSVAKGEGLRQLAQRTRCACLRERQQESTCHARNQYSAGLSQQAPCRHSTLSLAVHNYLHAPFIALTDSEHELSGHRDWHRSGATLASSVGTYLQRGCCVPGPAIVRCDAGLQDKRKCAGNLETCRPAWDDERFVPGSDGTVSRACFGHVAIADPF